MDNMNIMAIGDPHGRLPDNLISIIKKRKIDAILITGDFLYFSEKSRLLHFKRQKDATTKKLIKSENLYEFINIFRKINIPILTTYGNLDNVRMLKRKTKYQRQLKIMHGNVYKFHNYYIIGAGDYLRQKNLFNIIEFQYRIVKLLMKYPAQQTIILSHYPPFGVLDQLKNGKHTGVGFLRDIIVNYKPLLFICGHIHEAKGVRNLEKTKVINAGAHGEYVVINLRRNKIKIK